MMKTRYLLLLCMLSLGTLSFAATLPGAEPTSPDAPLATDPGLPPGEINPIFLSPPGAPRAPGEPDYLPPPIGFPQFAPPVVNQAPETSSETAEQEPVSPPLPPPLPNFNIPAPQEPQVIEIVAETPEEPVAGETMLDQVSSDQEQLDELQVALEEANQRVEELTLELKASDQKRRQQAVLIDFLEQELQRVNQRNPDQESLRNAVFDAIFDQLPESPVYRVEGNRLVIMTDFILAFGRGEVNTEGETRLQLVASALQKAQQQIADEVPWRWQVEGHSDSQPLRSITWFPSNWELSAARASGVARYLIDQGIPAERIRVSALGATAPVDADLTVEEGDDEHWRNRRVEIELVFETD